MCGRRLRRKANKKTVNTHPLPSENIGEEEAPIFLKVGGGGWGCCTQASKQIDFNGVGEG